MLGTFLLVTTALVGIDVGWEPDSQGQLQYIVQIQPEMIQAMVEGRAIEFDVLPEHQGVRRFRFQVGKESLPQIGSPVPQPPVETAAKEPPPANLPHLGPQSGTQSPDNTHPDQPITHLNDKPTNQQIPERTTTRALPSLDQSRLPDSPSSPSTSSAPGIFATDPETHPIREKKATYNKSVDGQTSPEVADPPSPLDETLKVPLIITSTTAASLLMAFLYLCWIHLGMRRRYHRLLDNYYSTVDRPSGRETSSTAGLPLSV